MGMTEKIDLRTFYETITFNENPKGPQTPKQRRGGMFWNMGVAKPQ